MEKEKMEEGRRNRGREKENERIKKKQRVEVGILKGRGEHTDLERLIATAHPKRKGK